MPGPWADAPPLESPGTSSARRLRRLDAARARGRPRDRRRVAALGAPEAVAHTADRLDVVREVGQLPAQPHDKQVHRPL